MGTPCACITATLYFAHYEKFTLLPKCNNSLLNYFRFIDDGLGIWIPNDHLRSDPNLPTFQDFKNDLNKFGLLRWTCEEPTNEVVYLDLVINLDNGKFKFKTFQKALNLYLYIPPHSAHPPGVQKSLIFGCIQKYWKQNSNIKDFVSIIRLFYHRLQARGYDEDILKQLFSEAASKLPPRNTIFAPSNKIETTNEKEEKLEELYFKYIYHPKDISRLTLRSLYETTCETPSSTSDGFKNFKISNDVYMKIDKLTIAYRRDENLRDRLMPSRLFEVPGREVSSYISK